MLHIIHIIATPSPPSHTNRHFLPGCCIEKVHRHDKLDHSVFQVLNQKGLAAHNVLEKLDVGGDGLLGGLTCQDLVVCRCASVMGTEQTHMHGVKGHTGHRRHCHHTCMPTPSPRTLVSSFGPSARLPPPSMRPPAYSTSKKVSP